MTLRDWIILIFTFFVAVLSGMYFYVTSWRPLYEEYKEPTVGAQNAELDIIGITYGGYTPQNYTHPSFRIYADGSYNYFAGGTVQGEKIEGELPRTLFRQLHTALAEADLEALSVPVSDKSCASYADGVEYEYNIDYEQVEYELDTCVTAFDNTTALGKVLLEVWDFMYEPQTYEFSVSNSPNTTEDDSGFRGLRGYFEDGFKKSGF